MILKGINQQQTVAERSISQQQILAEGDSEWKHREKN